MPPGPPHRPSRRFCHQHPPGTPTLAEPVPPGPGGPAATRTGPGGGGDRRWGLPGGGGDQDFALCLSLQSHQPKPDPIGEPGSRRGAGAPSGSFSKSRPDLPVVRAVSEVVLWGRGSRCTQACKHLSGDRLGVGAASSEGEKGPGGGIPWRPRRGCGRRPPTEQAAPGPGREDRGATAPRGLRGRGPRPERPGGLCSSGTPAKGRRSV